MNIHDPYKSPDYTIMTRHDPVVTMNHASEAPKLPIDASQL